MDRSSHRKREERYIESILEENREGIERERRENKVDQVWKRVSNCAERYIVKCMKAGGYEKNTTMSKRGSAAEVKKKNEKKRKKGRKNKESRGGEIRSTGLKKDERRDIISTKTNEIQAIYNQQRKRREEIDQRIEGITFKSEKLEQAEIIQRISERACIQEKWDDIKNEIYETQIACQTLMKEGTPTEAHIKWIQNAVRKQEKRKKTTTRDIF